MSTELLDHNNLPAFIRTLRDLEAQVFMAFIEDHDDVPEDITGNIDPEMWALLSLQFKRYVMASTLSPHPYPRPQIVSGLERGGIMVVEDREAHRFGVELATGCKLWLYNESPVEPNTAYV